MTAIRRRVVIRSDGFHLQAPDPATGHFESVIVFDDAQSAEDAFFNELQMTDDILLSDWADDIPDTADLNGAPYESLLGSDWGDEVESSPCEHPDSAEEHPALEREVGRTGTSEEGE